MESSVFELDDTGHYRELLAVVPGGVAIADENYKILFASSGLYPMLGYGKKEFFEKFSLNCRSLLRPCEEGDIFRAAGLQVKRGGCFTIKAELCHKNLGYTFVEINGKVKTADSGKRLIYMAITDVTRHKKQLDELSALAQRDQLTGLYHKAATENLIKSFLRMRRAQDFNCALLIIDVDNFKSVNDKMGHLYGDAVLTQLAEHLRSPFRSDDIVGRVGGDEFFVFIKNYSSVDTVISKATEINSLFNKTYTEGETFVTISASIGISLCPSQGCAFDELYKKADVALYNAKAMGKNTYSFYNSDLKQNYTSQRTEIDAGSMQKSFKDNRIEYAFRLLYNSENPVSSIQAVLQLVTESFGFSRGYIFETSRDEKFTSNTFEWCAREISTEIGNLQNLPIESVASAHASFNETGMFILKSVSGLPKIERDVLEPQGILSMFQFGIKDRGKLIGFIGFDDCKNERVPTNSEIDEICTVCHVLATFLLRQRSNERKTLHHIAVETVMDSVSSLVFVIDRSNYKVLYENKRVLDLVGGSSVGKTCYSAYLSAKKPCDECPLHCTDSGSRAVEVYNERYGIYMRSEATPINWADTRDACLVCCTDITEYKKSK